MRRGGVGGLWRDEGRGSRPGATHWAGGLLPGQRSPPSPLPSFPLALEGPGYSLPIGRATEQLLLEFLLQIGFLHGLASCLSPTPLPLLLSVDLKHSGRSEPGLGGGSLLGPQPGGSPRTPEAETCAHPACMPALCQASGTAGSCPAGSGHSDKQKLGRCGIYGEDSPAVPPNGLL